MVDDAHQGRGIASLFLEHLAVIARSNGITAFTAEVLSANRAMLRVFGRAGWPIERSYDSGVTELEFPLVDTPNFVDSVEQREHRADSRAVARLLLPRSIAVIGASDREGSVGREPWRTTAAGFAGPVFPVNRRAAGGGRRAAAGGGVRAYASIGDIEDDVWLAVIAVPRQRSPPSATTPIHWSCSGWCPRSRRARVVHNRRRRWPGAPHRPRQPAGGAGAALGAAWPTTDAHVVIQRAEHQHRPLRELR